LAPAVVPSVQLPVDATPSAPVVTDVLPSDPPPVAVKVIATPGTGAPLAVTALTVGAVAAVPTVADWVSDDVASMAVATAAGGDAVSLPQAASREQRTAAATAIVRWDWTLDMPMRTS
jgi:hypothetical protein